MQFSQVLWLICYVLALVQAAPKPPGETADHGNKDIGDIEEGRRDRLTTQSPEISPELSPELPETWDQNKEDPQSLFLNKSDKNDLEPYPMALADDAYDGQPIRADAQPEKPAGVPAPGALEHVMLRAELYGEPPSMGRAPQRRKRGGMRALRSDLGASVSRVSKMAPRYSALNRYKRDSNFRPEDILALLSSWEAQQRRSHETSASNYYPPENYENQDGYDDNTLDERDEGDERWMNEPIIPTSHFSHPMYALHPPMQPKPVHYQYSRGFPEILSPEPAYLQNVDALRRKRQWSGFGNRNHQVKRFMVAKKRSLSYRPREDLYSLNELLRSSGPRDQGLPIVRRMIL